MWHLSGSEIGAGWGWDSNQVVKQEESGVALQSGNVAGVRK